MDKNTINLIYDNLSKLHTNAECELNYTTPFELLVAVILSAQCTDKRVNMVTKELFLKYNTPEDYARLTIEELKPYIYSTGFYNNKAKNIIKMANSLIDKYQGKLPEDVEELITLEGVGRKTASVLRAVAFNKPAMPVDTHVYRVSRRLGLSKSNNVDGVEKDLKKAFDESSWSKAHHLLLFHGRYICVSRNPKCNMCNLVNVCKYFKTKKD